VMPLKKTVAAALTENKMKHFTKPTKRLIWSGVNGRQAKLS